MKVVYRAFNGEEFESEKDCLEFEKNIRLKNIRNIIYNNVSMADHREILDQFMKKHFDEIKAVFVETHQSTSDTYSTPDEDGWYTNIGNNSEFYLNPNVKPPLS